MPSPRPDTTTSLKPVLSSRQVNAQRYIGRFLNEQDNIEQDPIEVSDDEDNLKNQQKRSSRTLPKSSVSRPTRRNATDPTSVRKHSGNHNEEERYFGGDLKRPTDAVTIPIPTDIDIQPTMPKAKPPSGGFRPIDTLNNRPVSHQGTKSHFVAAALKRLPPTSPKRTRFSQTSKEEPPKKKPRVDNGSPDVLQERGWKYNKLTLESGNFSTEDLVLLPTDSPNCLPAPNIKSSRPGRSSPVRVMRSEKVQVPREDIQESKVGPIVKKSSSIDMVISDEDETKFTKVAAKERRSRKYSENDIEEIGENKHAITWVNTSDSIISAQQQSSSLSKRIEELDEILPDTILQLRQTPSSSPDVIQGPHFENNRDTRSMKKSRIPYSEAGKPLAEHSTPAHIKLFRPKSMLFGRAPTDVSNYELKVDKKARTFSIEYTGNLLSEEAILPEMPVDRILKVFRCATSAKVKIETSKIEGMGNEILLELNSPQLAHDLAGLLSKLGTRIDVKPMEDVRMDKVFEKFLQTSKQDHKVKRTSQSNAVTSHYFPEPDSRRRRGSAAGYVNSDRSLIDASAATHVSESRKGESVSGRRQRMLKQDFMDRRVQDASNGRTDEFQENGLVYRNTRASAARTSPTPPLKKYSHFANIRQPWKSPLTYPIYGKKRATVNFDDLSRLDDDEFLNDNIIAFFVRYLEHYLEQEKPDIARRSHFFNTYFYEKLRQNPKDKKNINYEGVKKWTDKISLFTRDFIVVPVNENLHWYLAIICNLSWFKLSAEEKLAAEAPEVFNQPLADTAPGKVTTAETDTVMTNAEDTQRSLQDLTLEDQERQIDIFISDIMPDSSGKSNGSAKKKGRKRKSERPLIGVNALRPTILTLDSLGLPRYATVKALKQYIVQEGKEKLSIDIDESEIQGLAAKRIPMQSNYSDCGLFVCAYLEKFTMDPADFKTKELERTEQVWPQLQSNDLRSRMRKLIQTLHDKQEGKGVGKTVPGVGEILLPPTASPISPKDKSFPINVGDETLYDSSTSPLGCQGDPTAASQKRANDPKNMTVRTAKILQNSVIIPESDSENEGQAHRVKHGDLVALASTIREMKSPSRKVRSGSVSTQFLEGDESYEHTEQQMPFNVTDGDDQMLV